MAHTELACPETSGPSLHILKHDSVLVLSWVTIGFISQKSEIHFDQFFSHLNITMIIEIALVQRMEQVNVVHEIRSILYMW